MSGDLDLDLGQLRALAAAVAEGTLEAAARRLHVTPSAISQRLRALEAGTGQVLLIRSRPVRPTAAGEAVLRLARQVELLTADVAQELSADGSTDPPALPIAVNADSLATWFLPAVAPLAAEFCFDLRREDQEHTGELLREGSVMAAVTAQAAAVPGCSAVRLGTMRYRPMATTAFTRRWFPDGVDADSLRRAPVVVFDRDDALQHSWLRRRSRRPLDPPLHHVPATADFAQAVQLGFGWGMLLPEQITPDVVDLAPGGHGVDVVLHWQRWKLRSPALDRVSDAVVAAGRRRLA